MTDYLKAAADARRLLAGFKAIDTVAAAFEHVGDLERAGAEAKTRLDQLTIENQAARDLLTATKAEAHGVKAKAAAALEEAKKKAEGIVAEAHAAAGRTARQADEDASSVLAAAEELRVTAEKAVRAAEVERDRLLAEVKALEARVEKARQYIAKLKE
jgi:cell division septum initiation protein DivIVA